MSGPWAAEAYHHRALGTPPTKLQDLRRSKARTTHTLRPLCCLTSLFASQECNENAPVDPAIVMPELHVTEWLALWFSDGNLRALVRRAWARSEQFMRGLPARNRWRWTRGPMAALQATMVERGWKIEAADRWMWQRTRRCACSICQVAPSCLIGLQHEISIAYWLWGACPIVDRSYRIDC